MKMVLPFFKKKTKNVVCLLGGFLYQHFYFIILLFLNRYFFPPFKLSFSCPKLRSRIFPLPSQRTAKTHPDSRFLKRQSGDTLRRWGGAGPGLPYGYTFLFFFFSLFFQFLFFFFLWKTKHTSAKIHFYKNFILFQRCTSAPCGLYFHLEFFF